MLYKLFPPPHGIRRINPLIPLSKPVVLLTLPTFDTVVGSEVVKNIFVKFFYFSFYIEK